MNATVYNEITIHNFLSNYRSSNIDFLPNLGNIGDMLIYASTFELFHHFDIRANILKGLPDCRNPVLFVSGGGNLVDNYENLLEGLRLIAGFYDEICVLPHTIYGDKSFRFFSNISTPIKILCRDYTSYNFLNSFVSKSISLYLCHDLAFCYDFSPYKISGAGVLNAFRGDSERTIGPIPLDNFDVSQDIVVDNQQFSYGFWLMDNWEEYLQKFLGVIAAHEVINTNRLHVAIAAAHLNKKVHLFPNSYHKNKAVYQYSLQSFHNVVWAGDVA